MNKDEKLQVVPLWEKVTLSPEEAAAYTGIGENKLRKLADEPGCDFVMWVGTNRRLLKRKKLEEFIDRTFSI